MKIFALCSGGDWADASVHHVILPDGVTIVSVQDAHRMYERGRHRTGQQDPYLSLAEFIVQKMGGTIPTADQLEEVWDC